MATLPVRCNRIQNRGTTMRKSAYLSFFTLYAKVANYDTGGEG